MEISTTLDEIRLISFSAMATKQYDYTTRFTNVVRRYYLDYTIENPQDWTRYVDNRIA